VTDGNDGMGRIQRNDIGTFGTQYIVESLTTNTAITTLDIGVCIVHQ
jgi:hypothetical protein